MDKLNLALLSEDNSTNDFLYVFSELSERPCRVNLLKDFKPEDFGGVIIDYAPKNVNYIADIEEDENGDEVQNSRYLVVLDNGVYISYVVLNEMSTEDSLITNLSFLFAIGNVEFVDEIVAKLSELNNEVESEEDTELEGIEQKVLEMLFITDGNISTDLYTDDSERLGDISRLYENSVVDLSNEMITELNLSDTGIVTISGERGTGKTGLLRHMADRIEKRVINVPIQLIDLFDTMDMHRFLSNNPGCVFILDDFDVEPRHYMKLINSIVQFVDGFKSGVYKAQFIICTNTDSVDDFEQCNNFLGTIEVGDLSEAKAKALARFLKIKRAPGANKLNDILKGYNVKQPTNIGY